MLKLGNVLPDCLRGSVWPHSTGSSSFAEEAKIMLKVKKYLQRLANITSPCPCLCLPVSPCRNGGDGNQYKGEKKCFKNRIYDMEQNK